MHRCRTLHGLLHALNNGKRCVCAVFLPGGISGNARAAMPRGGALGGDRSQPALSLHNPGPPYPRPACLWAAVFIFCPFYKGARNGAAACGDQESSQLCFTPVLHDDPSAPARPPWQLQVCARVLSPVFSLPTGVGRHVRGPAAWAGSVTRAYHNQPDARAMKDLTLAEHDMHLPVNRKTGTGPPRN